MAPPPSDALVFFGATGDLAHKKIFPALQSMVKRGHLSVPVIGVAKAGWKLDQLRDRARDSVATHGGGVDTAAFDKLSSLLRYVDGDYQDPATFDRLRRTLGAAERPLHYLAIPPSLFSTVVEQLGRSGCARGGRVVAEKPFGHDLASAQALNRSLLAVFPEPDVFRIDHYLGKEPVQNLLYFRFSNSLFEPIWNRNYCRQCADHDGRGLWSRRAWKLLRPDGRHPGRHREPPVAGDGLSGHGCTVERPSRNACATRRRACSKRSRPSIRWPSCVGSSAATVPSPESQPIHGSRPSLPSGSQIDNWRWAGVPFYIRAGKCLPVTCTEVLVEFKAPPSSAFGETIERPNYVRFRLGPDVAIALGVRSKTPGEAMAGRDGRASRDARHQR